MSATKDGALIPGPPGVAAAVAAVPFTPPLPTATTSVVAKSGEPTTIRSFALLGLFLMALVYTLHFGRPIILPLVVAMVANAIFRPLVRLFGRMRVPEAAGAGVVVLGLVAVLVGMILLLAGPFTEWMERLPGEIAKVLARIHDDVGPMDTLAKAGESMKKLAEISVDEKSVPVHIEGASMTQRILTGTQGFVMELLAFLTLLYFLLASGDNFIRKIVKVMPRLQDKIRAVEITREIQVYVSSYLITISLINLGLGIAVGTGLAFLGMPDPVLWGVMVALINYVPYVGGLFGMLTLGLAAFAHHGTLDAAWPPVLLYLVLNSLEGLLVTPLIIGKRFTMSAVVQFVALLFWGWIWGVAGVLLAVPLVAVIKIVCDRVESLAPVGDFLGE